MKSIALIVLVLFFSCNGQKKTIHSVENEKKVNQNELILILQDDHGGMIKTETLIIRDYKTLKRFYSKINRTRKPGLPVPIIDFTKEIVVIYCSGELNSNLISTLSISEVSADQLILQNTIQQKKQQSAGITITPFSIYKMPLTTKEVVVKREQ